MDCRQRLPSRQRDRTRTTVSRDGGTDAKYWNEHSNRVFRFLAVPFAEGDVARVHGVNERIKVEDYGVAVGFFTRLQKGLDQLR